MSASHSATVNQNSQTYGHSPTCKSMYPSSSVANREYLTLLLEIPLDTTLRAGIFLSCTGQLVRLECFNEAEKLDYSSIIDTTDTTRNTHRRSLRTRSRILHQKWRKNSYFVVRTCCERRLRYSVVVSRGTSVFTPTSVLRMRTQKPSLLGIFETVK